MKLNHACMYVSIFCRGPFDAKFTTEEISVFEILGNGFSKICQIWLKEKPDGIAKCWGVAFLGSKLFVIQPACTACF